MDKILALGETEIEKHKFHQHKNQLSIYDVDTNKMFVYSRVAFHKKGFKYCLGYRDR